MSTVTGLAPADSTGANSRNAAPETSRRSNTPLWSAGTPKAKAIARRGVSALSTLMVVVAVAAFLLLAVGPHVVGYKTATMLTGSMSPLINPGDVVVTAPTPVSGIRAGDVITYRIPVEDNRVETHRVTEVLTGKEGSTAVRTKGDANDSVDPWTAALKGATVDRHVLTVPYVGHTIRALRQPAVLNTLMYGASGVLVIGLLGSIWRKSPAQADG